MTKQFVAHRPKPAAGGPARAERAPVPAEPRARPKAGKAPDKPKEIVGPSGPEPTRYGDWERKGICVDF